MAVTGNECSGKGEIMERCCGSCIYHEHEDDVDYRCVCADSDECDKYTMFLDCCDYWQGWYYTGK